LSTDYESLLINRAAFSLINHHKCDQDGNTTNPYASARAIGINLLRSFLNFALMIAIPVYIFTIDMEGSEDAVS